MATITNGITTSFANTPQAGNDLFSNTGLTEDSSSTVMLDVMANDLGGAAKTLYSLDNGIEDDGVVGADLLIKDAIGSTQYSALGASISITTDGKVAYTLTDSVRDQLQHLAQGETLTDTFTYAIRLGNGTLSWASATVQIAGSNDAPVITVGSGDSASANLTETNAGLNTSGTLTVTDVDVTDVVTPSVVSVSVGGTGGDGGIANATLLSMLSVSPSPVDSTSTTSGTLAWAFNSGSEAFNYLADGETIELTYTVRATDDSGQANNSDDQTVTITITGSNDAPVITSGSAASTPENVSTSAVVYDANATDPDAGATLTYSFGGGADDALFNIDSSTGEVTFKTSPNFEAPADSGANNEYDIMVAASDGTLSDAKAVTITVTDVNEAPTAVVLSNTVTSTPENGAAVKVADIAITDDALGTNVLSLSGADAASFSLSGNELWFSGGANYEAKSSYDVTVNVDDAGVGATPDASQNFTLSITDVNEAPTVASPYTGTGDPNDFDNLLSASASSSSVGLTVTGDNQANVIHGSNYVDILNGAGGDDSIYGHNGNDIIDGGNAADTHLYGQAGDDTIYGGQGADQIWGGSGNDNIYGISNPETTSPPDGGDTIYGGSGSDTIYGQAGNDTIIGGYGADTLSGGSGNDTFEFRSVLDTGDVLTGWSGADDTLDFSAIDTNSGVAGDQAFVSATNSTTVTARGINYFDDGSGNTVIWADTDGNTSTVELQITLSGVTASSLISSGPSSDFIL